MTAPGGGRSAGFEPPGHLDPFTTARAVADAVLYEGYLLYPYRASAAKNRHRFQFGVLAPPGYVGATGSERSSCATECLVAAPAGAAVRVRLRCLQVRHRLVERWWPDGNFTPVDALDVAGARVLPWDEAVAHDLEVASVAPDGPTAAITAVTLPGSQRAEVLRDGERVAGRIVRRCEQVDGQITVTLAPQGVVAGLGPVRRVRVAVENCTPWDAGAVPRDEALRRCLVATHVLLHVEGGSFLSVLDPPAGAADAAAACRQDGLYPVLVGDATVVLAAPIILYDHPQIAPESPGDLFDATEIDEILALRILTLTDAEKAEARATDPRAAAIVDRCDGMPPEVWARLHGAMRDASTFFGPHGTGGPRPASDRPEAPWWDPEADAAVDPATDEVVVAGVRLRAGSPVRLRPARRADAHDLFLAGRTATVAGVFHDVDGAQHVAVTLDGDPAGAELARHGRYLYFHPDELEPLAGAEAEP